MGAETGLMALLLPALISAGGGVGEALLTPEPQRFSSFEGTDNDPGDLLSEAGGNLRDIFSQIAPRLLAPPDMRDAYIQDLPVVGRPNRATWGGGVDGPKRRTPAMPTAPAAPSPDMMSGLLSQLGGEPGMIDSPALRGGAGTSTGPQWSNITDQLMQTMNPRNIPSRPERVAYAPGQKGPIADALRSVDGGVWTGRVGANARTTASNPRTLGAVQMLMHLAQPQGVAA